MRQDDPVRQSVSSLAWWDRLGVQWKLHILIQGTLILIFLVSQQWIVQRFESQEGNEVRSQASGIADGLINGMNMLMVTGKIGNPANRLLLLKKMSDSPGVVGLRIVRAKQVSDQFGPGLPSEQAVDGYDREAIESRKPVFLRTQSENGKPLLRAVIPYIVSENFRGTNCLMCHHVKVGSVNGAASITIDLSKEESRIQQIRRLLWTGNIAFQIGLSIVIALFTRIVIVRDIEQPSQKLQSTMLKIRRDGDLSLRAEIDGKYKNIDEMAETFNLFVENLEEATKDLMLFAEVIKNTEEAIIISDANNIIVSVNRAFVRITGYSEAEVIGKNPRLLSSGRQDKEFYLAMWQSIRETGHWQGEIWNRRKSGEIYPEWLSISTVKNSRNEIMRHVAIFMDITKRKEVEQRIHFLAYYDPLTNLPNRVLFGDRLGQALAASRRGGGKVALLFLDLDRFKGINDSLGHAAGDLLLQSVADRLKLCIREMDSICRQGGDEFMIMLPGIEKRDDVAAIAQKIIAAMSEPHHVDGRNLIVSFSIGISIYPDDADNSEALIQSADAAMYHAKEHGRNNFQFFTADMNAEALDLLSLEADLRRAMANRELMIHYQPQIDNATGEIVGVEALARWFHPERGFVPPSRFVSIAEESGLIGQLGEWVLRTACAQNKQWQEEGLVKIPVAVNLSALQFHQKDLVEMIVGILHETGLEPRYLELELTEGIIMKNAESTIATLNALKQAGIMLSIDDFGTGYSSLSYLKRFPIDKLKIDQSFISDIATNEDDAMITTTIISMGHNLRLKVIAEGVETEEQIGFLREHQCDETQGYYVSTPLSPEEFAGFIKSRLA